MTHEIETGGATLARLATHSPTLAALVDLLAELATTERLNPGEVDTLARGYLELCELLGREVKVSRYAVEQTGKALDLAEQAAAVARFHADAVERLTSTTGATDRLHH